MGWLIAFCMIMAVSAIFLLFFYCAMEIDHD